MFEIENMPLLPGSNERKMEAVNTSDLKSVGVSGSAFALHTGDIIKFPEGSPLVIRQEVRKDSKIYAYYVAVERNGKASWLGIVNLTRRDVDNKPLGKIQEEMCAKANFEDVYSALAGKTIKCGESKTYKFAKFENGVRLEGETVERAYPTIEYVN